VAEFEIKAGAKIDILNKGELDHSLKEAEAREVAALRGLKPLRFMLTGAVASSACTIGDPSTASTGGVISGPEQGYVWVVRHLVIEGLTASATAPDVMNIYRNARIVWQLNGNVFCQTWGKGEILLNPGEVLYFKNSGSLAATGQITCHGTVWNVPAELIGKVF
jgi:hypothetical protein